MGGSYPFDGLTEPIERQIQNPKLNFQSPVSGRAPSKEAQDLMSKLIQYKPKDRISLDQVLDHEWVPSRLEVDPGLSPAQYVQLALPSKPSKPQRNQMVDDLRQFQLKFKCFTQV